MSDPFLWQALLLLASESTRSEAHKSRLRLDYERLTEDAIYSLTAMQDQYALKEFLSAAVHFNDE
jgi:hypothetical protein